MWYSYHMDSETYDILKTYQENIDRCLDEQSRLTGEEEDYYEIFENLQKEIQCNEELIALMLKELQPTKREH